MLHLCMRLYFDPAKLTFDWNVLALVEEVSIELRCLDEDVGRAKLDGAVPPHTLTAVQTVDHHT